MSGIHMWVRIHESRSVRLGYIETQAFLLIGFLLQEPGLRAILPSPYFPHSKASGQTSAHELRLPCNNCCSSRSHRSSYPCPNIGAACIQMIGTGRIQMTGAGPLPNMGAARLPNIGAAPLPLSGHASPHADPSGRSAHDDACHDVLGRAAMACHELDCTPRLRRCAVPVARN